jgi:ApaLI-like restriction endonuclease.
VSISIRKLFAECRVHGNGDAQVMLTNLDIKILLHILCRDLEIQTPVDLCAPDLDYYKIPMEVYESRDCCLSDAELMHAFQYVMSLNDDYPIYMKNLCALHRRRIKYSRILSTQMKADFEQISPRSLLEYGLAPSKLLCNWMLWRKWIYDIDNRSAQEAGYLFEPIVAGCMGGAPVGAKCSPVKRVDKDGNQTKDGRQIDCYIPVEEKAYELKLRVTIAASGQGRWGEELSFPFECKVAGITPYLLVLDPTPSHRLTDLIKAYEDAGGFYYLGEDAWAKMESEAGQIMGKFVEKYIRPPLQDMSSIESDTLDPISMTWNPETIEITSSGEVYSIKRKPQ